MAIQAGIDSDSGRTENEKRIQLYVKDIDYVSRSIVYLQIAAAIYMIGPLAMILLRYNDTHIWNIIFGVYIFLLVIGNLLNILATGLMLTGVGRICYFLRNEVKIVYLLSAVVSILFFIALKGVDFVYFIKSITRGENSIVEYYSSELRFALILIFLPIAIFSCMAAALRLNKHFDLKPDRTKQIYLLSTALGIIGAFRIITGLVQWLRFKETIEFPLRYNQISQIDYVYAHIFFYGYILILLWFIWLFIVLRLIKFSRIELPETYKRLVIN